MKLKVLKVSFPVLMLIVFQTGSCGVFGKLAKLRHEMSHMTPQQRIEAFHNFKAQVEGRPVQPAPAPVRPAPVAAPAPVPAPQPVAAPVNPAPVQVEPAVVLTPQVVSAPIQTAPAVVSASVVTPPQPSNPLQAQLVSFSAQPEASTSGSNEVSNQQADFRVLEVVDAQLLGSKIPTIPNLEGAADLEDESGVRKTDEELSSAEGSSFAETEVSDETNVSQRSSKSEKRRALRHKRSSWKKSQKKF